MPITPETTVFELKKAQEELVIQLGYHFYKGAPLYKAIHLGALYNIPSLFDDSGNNKNWFAVSSFFKLADRRRATDKARVIATINNAIIELQESFHNSIVTYAELVATVSYLDSQRPESQQQLPIFEKMKLYKLVNEELPELLAQMNQLQELIADDTNPLQIRNAVNDVANKCRGFKEILDIETDRPKYGPGKFLETSKELFSTFAVPGPFSKTQRSL